MQVDVAVVVDAGLALDLEQRGLAHARQRVEIFLVGAAAQRCLPHLRLASGPAEAAAMTGFGCCGSGAISGAAAAGVEPNSEANRLRFFGWRAAQPSPGRWPSHRPGCRRRRVPAGLAARHGCVRRQPLRRRSVLAHQRPPLALPEGLKLVRSLRWPERRLLVRGGRAVLSAVKASAGLTAGT